MLIDEVTNAGAIPALEFAVRFAARRHTLIANNVANFDTPDYRPADVSVQDFRRVLARAVDRRRDETGGEHGELNWRPTRQIRPTVEGGIRLRPTSPSNNILFHDRNNRDLERTMQALTENMAAFRVASDLLRSRVAHIRKAIAERV